MCLYAQAAVRSEPAPVVEQFRIDTGFHLTLTAEWHKTTADGWTPVFLEIGGMSFPKWMDWDGCIVTYPSADVPESQVLARWDLDRDLLIVGAREIPLRIVTATDARAQAIVPGEWVDGRIRLRLERNAGLVSLFGDRLRLGHLFLDRHRCEKYGRVDLDPVGPYIRDRLVLDVERDLIGLARPNQDKSARDILRPLAFGNGDALEASGRTEGPEENPATAHVGSFSVGLAAGEKAKIPIEEREALIALYLSTDGNHWDRSDNWKQGEYDPEPGEFEYWGSECGWWGVECDPGGTHVIKLNMHNNNLAGPLPEQIGQLLQLQELELYGNQLTTLPAGLGQLKGLQLLDLYYNPITGAIPDTIGGMTSLRELYLPYNPAGGLSGPIPETLGNLANLERMDIAGNQLTGPIQIGRASCRERV